jgi:hypothetical protein
VLPANSKWPLPASRVDMGLAALPNERALTDIMEQTDFDEARLGFKHDFFRDDEGSEPYDDDWSRDDMVCMNNEKWHHKRMSVYITETKVNTLSTSLVKLHDV